MNILRKCVSFVSGSKIKASPAGSGRRQESKTTFRPTLESLEQRDVPSGFNFFDAGLFAMAIYAYDSSQPSATPSYNSSQPSAAPSYNSYNYSQPSAAPSYNSYNYSQPSYYSPPASSYVFGPSSNSSLFTSTNPLFQIPAVTPSYNSYSPSVNLWGMSNNLGAFNSWDLGSQDAAGIFDYSPILDW